MAVLTKGSAALKKRLTDKHGHKPEFQRLLKSTGQDKETWHVMYQRKKAKEKGEVATERRKQMSLKAYGATKGTGVGGEHGGGFDFGGEKDKATDVLGRRGAGEVKTLSVAEYLKQKEKEEREAAEAKRKREMKEQTGAGVGWMLRADPKLAAKVKANIDKKKQMDSLMKKYGGKTGDEIAKMKKEEASPMIKPPSNMFDNKKDAFAHAKKHGGKVYRREYTNPRSGMKSTTYSVKEEVEQIDELTGIKNNPDARYDYIDTVKKKHLRHDSDEWGDRAGKPPIGFKRMKRYSKAVRAHKSYLDQRRLAKYLNKEEVEQMDEISKKTLGSYVKKAAPQLATSLMTAATTKDIANAEFHGKRYAKRQKGINKAVDKLAKEEVELEEAEQIDERGDYWHPDPEQDRKVGGRGLAIMARQNKAKPPVKNDKLDMLKKLAAAGKKIAAKPAMAEGLDKVGKETSDIDNDKDVDKTDMYLHNRRAAVKKAIMKKKLQEAKTPGNIVGSWLMARAEKKSKQKKKDEKKPALKPMKEEKAKKVADKVLASKRGVTNKIDRKPTLEVDLKAHPSPAPTHDDTDNTPNVQV
jgi:hypothetical protein